MQSVKDIFYRMNNVTDEEKREMNQLLDNIKKIANMKELLKNISSAERLAEMVRRSDDN